MNRVVKILMDRDGMTEIEAKNLVSECRDEIYTVLSSDEAEDIIMDMLGLEPDYLDDILWS